MFKAFNSSSRYGANGSPVYIGLPISSCSSSGRSCTFSASNVQPMPPCKSFCATNTAASIELLMTFAKFSGGGVLPPLPSVSLPCFSAAIAVVVKKEFSCRQSVCDNSLRRQLWPLVLGQLKSSEEIVPCIVYLRH